MSDATSMTDGRVVRARKLRQARRIELLQASKDVFAELGYHGASLKHLLEAAGVARATFYKHFDGKEAAFAAVL
ncbi:MAG: AcrR family transcriptional regulator [Myxococcota bacterium]|jgi:AcrR family transcriptional regulator